MLNIKKVLYSKKGSRWGISNTKEIEFNTYNEAKVYYNNIVNDNFGKTRTERNYSQFGVVSKKSFYSPSGIMKVVYDFK